MRIVALADTHMYHDALAVPPGDILILAGDLCTSGALSELRRALDWFRELPHPHKVLIAGNHDWPFQTEPTRARSLVGPGIHYLEDREVTVAGLRIWGTPWQPEFGGWAFNLPRGSALADKWALIPTGIDILVSHGPPAGYGDRNWLGGRTGCGELLRRIEVVQPRLVVYGHIHEDGGVWQLGPTLLANVTTAEGDRAPTVFHWDPARGMRVLVAPKPLT